jgi:hypothetical protein
MDEQLGTISLARTAKCILRNELRHCGASDSCVIKTKSFLHNTSRQIHELISLFILQAAFLVLVLRLLLHLAAEGKVKTENCIRNEARRK